MAKKAKPSSSNTYAEYKDWISILPDEILIKMLSLLTLKEAAKTSVLSRRWKDLWRFSSGSLDFDGSQVSGDVHFETSLLAIERSKYVSWVNQVLKTHQGPTIKEFKFCFSLNGTTSRTYIDSWIKFAMEKRVQRLELDFKPNWQFPPAEHYIFPSRFLGSCSFSSLTSLSLRDVEVTAEVVEHLLSNCPSLERLCLAKSSSLGNLKVSGPSLKLKYLEIYSCSNLRNLEVHAANLVSLKYSGGHLNMLLEHVPNLVEVSFEGGYCESFLCDQNEVRRSLLSSLSQLEKITFNMPVRVSIFNQVPFDFVIEMFLPFPKFPELSNLQQLELQVPIGTGDALFRWTSLLSAAPILNRLRLKLVWEHPLEKKRHRRFKNIRHKCLKVVELAEFDGCSAYVDIIRYFLKVVVSLEKIIIDPRSPSKFSSRGITEGSMRAAAKKRARFLEPKVPPGVELVIL